MSMYFHVLATPRGAFRHFSRMHQATRCRRHCDMYVIRRPATFVDLTGKSFIRIGLRIQMCIQCH
jgi:hypothetical protein